MSYLKFKDADGNVSVLDVIKGEDGEDGKSGSVADIYSTEEKQIGAWQDENGNYYPLYRISTTINITENGETFSGVTISDLNTVVGFSGSMKVNNYWLDLSTDSTYGVEVRGIVRDGLIGVNAVGWKGVCKISVEYTKTTDISIDPNTMIPNIDYSTEETYTGKHWIDGKKIYRRVFIVNNPTKNNSIIIDSNLIYDTIIHSEGNFSSNGGNGWYDGTNYQFVQIFKDTNNRLCVVYRTNKYDVNSITIVIEYTKTTD